MNNQHESSNGILRRHRNATLLVVGGLLAAGAVALATLGIGGGGRSTAGDSMAGMSMAAPAAGNNTPVATDEVKIKNFGFSPATITLTAGSTVVWTNGDSVQHDVTFDGGGIGSSVLNHNDTFSHTFQTAGTYHYICSIHPFMHGTVIVTGSGSHNATATQPAASVASGY